MRTDLNFRTKMLASMLLLTGLPTFASATDYDIDADHSGVGFKIKHLGISSVKGNFTKFQGTFSYDPANVAASKTEAEITVGSINTEQTKRDDHLKGEDFFAATKFPAMKFKSTSVVPGSGNQFKINGDLTIKDVTKPVTLDAEFIGAAKDPWGNERAGFSATTKINRKDFGLTWNKVLETGGLVVGDEVAIDIEIEGTKKK